MNDKKLWAEFSIYIRVRDADSSGICRCFTCGLMRHWTGMDCGHGIGRQHKATKYNEKNNHAQCKKCNGFEGGRMDVYKEEVDKRYGTGTWDILLFSSRQAKKYSQWEVDELTKYYIKEADKIMSKKNLSRIKKVSFV